MNPCRILVVEDEAIVAMDVEERLTGMGYEPVGRAGSGEQALELTRLKRPDLVLMDIRLKGTMDGIGAAELIRRQFRVPVVFLTAYSEDSTLERAKLAEPYGYILKPFEDSALRSAIEIAIHKHAAEEEIRRLNRLYDLLSQVNQAVVRIETRDELLSTIPRLVVERGAVDFAWIGWLDPATSKIRPVAYFGQPAEMLNLSDIETGDAAQRCGLFDGAVREGQYRVCHGCDKEECLFASPHGSSRFGFQSCGCFPLHFHGQFCGVLGLCLTESCYFCKREISLLKEVAMDVSFALDKIDGRVQKERAEAALRKSEKRLNLALTAARMGVWEWDLRTDSMFWSDECEEIIPPEVCGETFESFLRCVHPEDAERVETAIRETIARHETFACEFRIGLPGGKARWLAVSARAEYEGDSPLLLVGTVENITERKRAEEERRRVEAQLRQVQKMEALGTLAGGIAHDFNNILAIIMGYTEMVYLDAEEESETRGQLWEVLQASARAKELVKQILAFSRRNDQEKKPIQISLIVKEGLKMLRATLPSTIAIKKEVSSTAVVLADPTQVHQVLMNLCTNAAHAMRESGGQMTVSLTDMHLGPEHIVLHPDLQQGPYVRLVVRDTGHGISPAVLDRIFDPFFTTKEQGVGTGLGLSVVHGIVKSHGGSIEVESSPDKGTAFQVLLPAMKGTQKDEGLEPVDLPRGKERILLADDEPALAAATKYMLEKLGYDVECRHNGMEALELFRERLAKMPFNVVVADVTMPYLTGLDLSREVHRKCPDLPVILCTGFSEKVDEGKAKELGIQGLLMKPFVLRELAILLRKVLDKPFS